MSWKLAELKWRHDIGLYESRWEKSSVPLPLERRWATEAFEKRDRRSRSWSPSRRFGKQSLAGQQDVGLGEPLLPASPTPRSAVKSTSKRTSPLRPTPDRGVSCSSLIPLLRTPNKPSGITAPSQSPILDEATALELPATRCQSCSALSDHSSRFRPSPDSTPPSEASAEEHILHNRDHRHVVSQDSEELDHLLAHQDSGISSSDFTERLLWRTPTGLSQSILIPDFEPFLRFQRETIESSVPDVLDNLLEFDGAVFELLNSSDTENLLDITAPPDSSDTRWPSTISKHRSTSLLIPLSTMADKANCKGQASQVNLSGNSIAQQEVPETKGCAPKRRMTPIYDDYQTAVSMIRSGTPGLRSPSASPSVHTVGDGHSQLPGNVVENLPGTPKRSFSYSMKDVHEKLAESNTNLQSALSGQENALKQSATTCLPSEAERRVSIPIFPLRGRDSDDENERLIARGEYPPGDNDDNPAGLELEDDDIPLREVELSLVHSSTRGDPVSSQEIHASTADFGHVEDPSSTAAKHVGATLTPASGSAPTDTSTIDNIVEQYVSTSNQEPDTAHRFSVSSKPETSSDGGNQSGQTESIGLHPGRVRNAADAGPPPSWPLPTPPALQRRNSNRRNSSGVLSSPAKYGNTSALLNPTSLEARTAISFASGLCAPPSTADVAKLKQSESNVKPICERGEQFDLSGAYSGNEPSRIRQSHVSEESSGQWSSISGGEGLIEDAGRQTYSRESSGFADHPGDHEEAEFCGRPNLETPPAATAWSPGRRRAESVSYYPSFIFGSGARRQVAKDLGIAAQFGSPSQIFAGQVGTPAGNAVGVDDTDWETIHESHSHSNLQPQPNRMVETERGDHAQTRSFSSMSLNKDPVSTWDPLSTNSPGFHRSEKKLGELLKSHKESTQKKQVDEVQNAGANYSNVPMLTAKAREPISLPGSANAAGKQAEPFMRALPTSSQVNKPKPAAHSRYRHPTPLQPDHRHPFTANRPVLAPLTKTKSTSSSDAMADNVTNLKNNKGIEPASSVGTGSFTSRLEYNNWALAEIDRYDPDRPRPRKVYPNARLTVDKRVRMGCLDSEFVETQHTLGKALLKFGVCTYFLGGFLLINSMTKNGATARDAMLQVSAWRGRIVVGTVHPDEVLAAKKWETRMISLMFAVGAAVIVVLSWAVSRL